VATGGGVAESVGGGAAESVGMLGDGLGGGTVDRDGAVELARTPVMVGAAEVLTAAAAGS